MPSQKKSEPGPKKKLSSLWICLALNIHRKIPVSIFQRELAASSFNGLARLYVDGLSLMLKDIREFKSLGFKPFAKHASQMSIKRRGRQNLIRWQPPNLHMGIPK